MSANKKKIRREIELNGIKLWVTANNEQEYADKILRLSAIARNSPSNKKHNFKEYAERWFSIFSSPNVSQVTSISYRRQLDLHIFPILGDKNIEDVTTADIQKVFNELGNLTKRETKNKVRIVLNQIMKTAVDECIIRRNPLDSSSLRIRGSAPSQTEPYSVEQMRYLASHIEDVDDETERAWLALSLSLPLRPEEILGLLWRNVDEKELTIHVRNTVTHPSRNKPVFKPYTKTASSIRDLVIPQSILSYFPKRGEPDEFVLGGKEPLSYTKLRGIRRRIAAQTGFDDAITPRRFRTTVATDISAATHDLKLVQKMLGHSTPQMTLKHYDKGRCNAVDASDAIEKTYGFSKS